MNENEINKRIDIIDSEITNFKKNDIYDIDHSEIADIVNRKDSLQILKNINEKLTDIKKSDVIEEKTEDINTLNYMKSSLEELENIYSEINNIKKGDTYRENTSKLNILKERKDELIKKKENNKMSIESMLKEEEKEFSLDEQLKHVKYIKENTDYPIGSVNQKNLKGISDIISLDVEEIYLLEDQKTAVNIKISELENNIKKLKKEIDKLNLKIVKMHNQKVSIKQSDRDRLYDINEEYVLLTKELNDKIKFSVDLKNEVAIKKNQIDRKIVRYLDLQKTNVVNKPKEHKDFNTDEAETYFY